MRIIKIVMEDRRSVIIRALHENILAQESGHARPNASTILCNAARSQLVSRKTAPAIASTVVAISLSETKLPWEGFLQMHRSRPSSNPRWARFVLLEMREAIWLICSTTQVKSAKVDNKFVPEVLVPYRGLHA